jgi:hypothetical protein
MACGVGAREIKARKTGGFPWRHSRSAVIVGEDEISRLAMSSDMSARGTHSILLASKPS